MKKCKAIYFDEENFNIDLLTDMEEDVAAACVLDIKDACKENFIRGTITGVLATATIIIFIKVIKYFAKKNV